jgi:hypothetical protein
MDFEPQVRHEGSATMSERPFRISVVSNDPAQYEAMYESFMAAGFSDANSVFEVFRNTQGDNRHEPYGVIRRVAAEATERYLIFCHQDVRLRPGGHDALLAQLRQLDQNDPTWAVAGNAGVDRHGRMLLHLNDPNAAHRVDGLPREVACLDENFLVVRRGSAATCSAELAGFHLYGLDICFHAMLAGQRCYVIDFLLDHLSAGSPGSRDYAAAQEAFASKWREHFEIAVVSTTVWRPMTVGTRGALRRLADSPYWRHQLKRSGATFVPRGTQSTSLIIIAALLRGILAPSVFWVCRRYAPAWMKKPFA